MVEILSVGQTCSQSAKDRVKKWWGIDASLLTSVLLIPSLSSCSGSTISNSGANAVSPSIAGTGPIQVVAAENFWIKTEHTVKIHGFHL